MVEIRYGDGNRRQWDRDKHIEGAALALGSR